MFVYLQNIHAFQTVTFPAAIHPSNSTLFGTGYDDVAQNYELFYNERVLVLV
jgi:hypothetical protein